MLNDLNIGVGDGGAGGAAALPTMEKFAKINHNRAENRPKIGQNFREQWIFYRAAPLNFIFPYAHESETYFYICPSSKHICHSFNNICH